jgi:hypothetical protein
MYVLQQNVSWYFNYSLVSFRVAATLKELTALIHLDFTSDISISSTLDDPPKQRKKQMQLMIVAKKITQ